MADVISNMRLSPDGRFFSHHGGECEYLRYPFTLRGQVSGRSRQIQNADDLRRFLIAEKDDGAVFNINDVLERVEDQTTWSGVTPLSKNAEKLGRMDENWLSFT